MKKSRVPRLLPSCCVLVIIAFVATLLALCAYAQERPSNSSSRSSSSSGSEERQTEERRTEPEEQKKEETGAIFAVVPEKRDGEQLISFSFDKADIDDVLKFLADASGKIIYKDPAVETQVTIVSMAKITIPDAFKVLSGLLSVKGYTMFMKDDEVTITTKEGERIRGGKRIAVGEVPAGIPPEEIITQILQIQFIDAAQLKDDLKPLFPDKGDTGLMLSNADTNTIVVIDTAERVKRIVELIRELDKDTSEAMEVRVIKLEYANAAEMAQVIESLFEQRSPFRGLSGDALRRMMEAGRSGSSTPGASPRLPTGLTAMRGEVRVSSDERTNSVIVSASKANLDNIEQMVTELDIDVTPDVVPRTFALTYADAATVAEQLSQLFEPDTGRGRSYGGYYGYYYGGSYSSRRSQTETAGLQPDRVVPDTRTNSIIVTAEEEDMGVYETIIKDLDRESPLEEVVRVFELENANAGDVAEALYDVFQGAQQRQRGFFFFMFGSRSQREATSGPLQMLQEVNVIADEQSNKLIVSGPAQTFKLVEQLINDLDKPLPQVFIEVVIADVTLDESRRFGFEWKAITTSGSTTSEIGTELGVAATDASEAGGFQYSILSRNFQSLLRALETEKDVQVVSTPHITVMDNTQATISIGESIPYTASTTETSGGGLQVSTELLPVTITLNVTPHINSSDQIALDVEQTIDSFIEFVDFGQGQKAPRTQQRSAETSVLVGDGQTVVLGGIMSDRESTVIDGVPILRDIPWIGKLFEQKRKQKTKTELMVFLTPHIVKDAGDTAAVFDQERGKLMRDPYADPLRQPIQLAPDEETEETGQTEATAAELSGTVR